VLTSIQAEATLRTLDLATTTVTIIVDRLRLHPNMIRSDTVGHVTQVAGLIVVIEWPRNITHVTTALLSFSNQPKHHGALCRADREPQLSSSQIDLVRSARSSFAFLRVVPHNLPALTRLASTDHQLGVARRNLRPDLVREGCTMLLRQALSVLRLITVLFCIPLLHLHDIIIIIFFLLRGY